MRFRVLVTGLEKFVSWIDGAAADDSSTIYSFCKSISSGSSQQHNQ